MVAQPTLIVQTPDPNLFFNFQKKSFKKNREENREEKRRRNHQNPFND